MLDSDFAIREDTVISTLRITLISLAVALACAAPAAAQTASKAAPKVFVPVGPKLLTVVAGRPFESIPASGPSKVSVVVCAEETEPATFSVKYSKPLSGVRVSAAGDFVGPGKIERLNFEVSRVSGDRLIHQVSSSTGAVFAEAEIGPQPVQFWVNVTVPRRTPPGLYKGAIAFYHQNKTFDVVSMEVQVLPLRLIGSSKQYSVYTAYGPGGAGNAMLTGEAYRRFLDTFRRLQFRSVSVNVVAADTSDALSVYKAVGLAEPAPMSGYAFGRCPGADDVSAAEAGRRTAGVGKVIYYCADNPTTDDQIEAAAAQAAFIRQAGGKTVARISDECGLPRLEPELDELCYWVEMPNVRSFIDGASKPTGWKWQWFWWDARKSALDNRRYAGVGLWKSGLYGGVAAWMPEEGRDPTEGLNGMLGEALREGIDDTRYLTTYMKALRELKDLKREKDKDYIASTESYVANFLKRPLDQVRPADLAAFRAKLAEFSMALEKRL